jgi:hypothetical protein
LGGGVSGCLRRNDLGGQNVTRSGPSPRFNGNSSPEESIILKSFYNGFDWYVGHVLILARPDSAD